ncbi:MAG: S8 family peptidase [Verrucomicrobiales bacterium]|jgi:hypothetical protein|nr:S8 family peptidase [Verrucomicrobiales bacterium]
MGKTRRFTGWGLAVGWGLSLSLLLGGAPAAVGQLFQAHDNIISGEYDIDGQNFVWAQDANNLIGTMTLYGMGYFGIDAAIASVEGGLVWNGHTVFTTRQEGIPLSIGPGITWWFSPATLNANSSIPYDEESAPGAGQYDSHATAVAAMMAGLDLFDGYLSALGTGIAPLAAIQSGAIAQSWDVENPGAFFMTKESFLTPYLQYFSGTGRVDVINSSWGYTDPTGRAVDKETGVSYAGFLDGLAHDNPTVALVVAAGNEGPDAAPGGPAAGFNGISVGALDYNDNHVYDHPAEFASGAPLDFYNPQTKQTIHGVRVGVDLAAPGTGMVLATYDPEHPAETDLYYINVAGSSFAAPMVSGGIALLKDLAKNTMPGNTNALDTRVIKVVLMAGATKTVGWNNGQAVNDDGVIETTQSLDYQVGAGLLNLTRSAELYQQLVTDSRIGLGLNGWDLAQIGNGDSVDYVLTYTVSDIELTVALTWFSNTIYDDVEQTYQDLSLSNLNLSVWLLDEDVSQLLATSHSLYNNTELLRLELDGGFTYGFTVTFDDMVYDMTMTDASALFETYALAWSAVAIPEPAAWAIWLAGLMVLVVVKSKLKSQISKPQGKM